MRWIPVLPVCSALVLFTVQALGQTAVVTAPPANQTVTQPAGTTFSINSLSIPGTLSISGDRTAMIQQTQTAPMPSDGSQQDVGGILYIDDDLRDFGVSSPAAYVKIRSIPIFPNYPPYFQAVRGTQLEFGTANGIYGRVPATTALTIDPNGLVGIGTTTPQNPLSLLYGINVDQNDQNPGSMFIGPQRSFGITFGDSSGEGIGSARTTGAPNYYGLDFFTSFQNRLSITTDGAVGIGTTAPVAKLEVNGGMQVDGSIVAQGITAQSISAQSITFPNGTMTAVPPTFLSSNNGYIGIGANAPASLLQIGQWQTQGDLTLFAGAADATATSKLSFDMTVAGGNGTSEIGSIRSMAYQNGGHNQLRFDVGAWNNNNTSAPIMTLQDNGSVGIGTTTPGQDLQQRNTTTNTLSAYNASGPVFEIAGTLALTTGAGGSMLYADGTLQTTAWNGTTYGQDYAESIEVVADANSYEAGDVISIDENETRKFSKTKRPYSKMVAGVYSTKPGLLARKMGTQDLLGDTEVPMAMMGIVPTKVNTENGPINRGDLLVSSSTPGYAMRGTDRDRLTGAIIGKALAPLKSGSGVIEVLLALQ